MTTALLTALLAAVPLPAPLAESLRAGDAHSHPVAIAQSDLVVKDAQRLGTLDTMLPSLSLTGSYTRNQYATTVGFPAGPGQPGTSITITPLDQLTGSAAVNVPLLNAASLSRYREADAARLASEAGVEQSRHDAQLDVALAYYQVVSAQGVAAAAARAVAVAQANQAVVEVRFQEGTANAVTVEKARVDTARARSVGTDAERSLAVARRRLSTLTGLPEVGALPEPGGPAPVLPPEEELLARALERRPEVAQAHALVRQAEAAQLTAKASFLPVISGSAKEYFTNATGFLGKSEYWGAGVSFGWNIDPVGSWQTVRQADAQAQAQQARLEQTLENVRDQVHQSWLDVKSSAARLEQVTAEVQSAQRALALATERLGAGTATSLEVSQAQSDAFTAEANHAQARADLAYAALALRRAAGESLLED